MVDRPSIRRFDKLAWQTVPQHRELTCKELLDPTGASEIGVAVSSILHERIGPGGLVLPHTHDVAEVIHFLEGDVRVLLEEEWSSCAPGDTLVVPKGVKHSVENPGDLPSCQISIFLPVVTGEGFNTFLEAGFPR